MIGAHRCIQRQTDRVG